MYLQSKDSSGRILSTAASSGNVERCHSSTTGKPYAVKKIPQTKVEDYEHLVQNEINAYRTTGAYDIPRVVRLKDTFVSSENEACLVTELVDGCELSKWPQKFRPRLSVAENEAWVKRIAVQLLDTLDELHHRAKYAHLDVTSNNIMLRRGQPHVIEWDLIRLLDLGLAQSCVTDEDVPQTRKICPEGCTPLYASPQQLYARQLMLTCTWSDSASSEAGSSHSTAQAQQQSTVSSGKGRKLMQRLSSLWESAVCRGKGASAVNENDDTYEDPDLWLDGPIIDVYSAGVVLYEMLTGVLPFEPSPTDERPVAPDWVPDENKESWEDYEAILQLQNAWARDWVALTTAEGVLNVKHPGLDRVRRCSAEPEKAAEFFAFVLYPGRDRMSAAIAQNTDYLRSLKLRLKEHYKHNPLKPCPQRPPRPVKWSFLNKDGLPPCASDDLHSSAVHISSTQEGLQSSPGEPLPHLAAAAHCPAQHMRFSSDPIVKTSALQQTNTMLAGSAGPVPVGAPMQPACTAVQSPLCQTTLQLTTADNSRGITAHPGGDVTAAAQLQNADAAALQQKAILVLQLQSPAGVPQLQDLGCTVQLQRPGSAA